MLALYAFRMYGALTGLSKLDTADTLGSDLVQEWRGSLRTPPPALQPTSPYWPGKDRKYADLTSEQIPLTESLMDCMTRTEPVWRDKILYEIKQGRNVLVVAHANTLRGLVKIIDNIGDDEIQGTYNDAFVGFALSLRASALAPVDYYLKWRIIHAPGIFIRCGNSNWNTYCL